MILDFIYILVGFVALIGGGDFLVKGAVGIAAKAKLSKLVIGMTVISFGTSAPELIVSLNAASQGIPEIAIGNVIGSNIANIALVLGVTVLIFPMPVSRNSIRYDWPMMMLSSLLFFVFAFDLLIARWEGLVLFLFLILFIVFLIRNSRKGSKIDSQKLEHVEELTAKINTWKHIFYVGIGLVGLFMGSKLLISGAQSIATAFGVSKHVIGITVIAFGTSVPELATSVIAAFKKETDISVGNLIGSNIFNIMAVLGLTGIVQPISIEENVMQWDIYWMLGISLILFPMMIFRRKVVRFSGAILLALYIIYILSLF